MVQYAGQLQMYGQNYDREKRTANLRAPQLALAAVGCAIPIPLQAAAKVPGQAAVQAAGQTVHIMHIIHPCKSALL